MKLSEKRIFAEVKTFFWVYKTRYLGYLDFFIVNFKKKSDTCKIRFSFRAIKYSSKIKEVEIKAVKKKKEYTAVSVYLRKVKKVSA